MSVGSVGSSSSASSGFGWQNRFIRWFAMGRAGPWMAPRIGSRSSDGIRSLNSTSLTLDDNNIFETSAPHIADLDNPEEDSELSAYAAISDFFAFLGACRFEEAMRSCHRNQQAINSALPAQIWQGSRSDMLHTTLMHVPRAESVLACLKFVNYTGDQRMKLQSMYSSIVGDIDITFKKARWIDRDQEPGPTAIDWLKDFRRIMLSRVDFLRVLRSLSEDDNPLTMEKAAALSQTLSEYEDIAGPAGGVLPRTSSEVSLDRGSGGSSDSSAGNVLAATGIEDWDRVMQTFRERVHHETRILIILLRAHTSIMSHDFLGSSTAVFEAHSRLMKMANGIELRGGGTGGDSRIISEWWTQMDGYWGTYTTRALQQYLNDQRPESGDEDVLTVDSNFGPTTIMALQRFLNREKYVQLNDDDVSFRGNQPKPGSARSNKVILKHWPDCPVDGNWGKPTKTAMQAFLKQKVPYANFRVDGRFHQKSSQALQVLLAEEGWYRPALHNLNNVHQSRVTMHGAALHRWLCAFQEALESNAGFMFHNIIADKETTRRLRGEMTLLSQRTAIPYFSVIETFVRKTENPRVVLVMDTSKVPNYSPKGYLFPLKDGEQRDHMQGLRSMPDVFCYPPDAVGDMKLKHWPTVVSLITENSRRLLQFGRESGMQQYFETKMNTTYFVQQLEVHLALVVMFDGPRRKAGSALKRFISFVRDGLRCQNVIAMLNPQSSASSV